MERKKQIILIFSVIISLGVISFMIGYYSANANAQNIMDQLKECTSYIEYSCNKYNFNPS